MKLTKYIFPVIPITVILLFLFVNIDLVFGQRLPAPTPPVFARELTLFEIELLIRRVARFLIIVSVVIAVIALLWGGILWTTAGGEQKRIDRAKLWFRNGLWGALIILAVGVIIQTLAGIVARTFFF